MKSGPFIDVEALIVERPRGRRTWCIMKRTTQATAVRLRLKLKDEKAPTVVIQLVTLFEEFCQNFPDLLPLTYGEGSKTDFINFHRDYLPTLLERTASWAQVEGFAEIQERANSALAELQRALPTILK